MTAPKGGVIAGEELVRVAERDFVARQESGQSLTQWFEEQGLDAAAVPELFGWQLPGLMGALTSDMHLSQALEMAFRGGFSQGWAARGEQDA